MVLEHYISELLYRYNCVVVPGFGAFLSQKIGARINSHTNTFYAPSKSVAFNAQLTSNDGLLISHLSTSEKITFEYSLERIEETVASWKKGLDLDSSLVLKNIGVLTKNSEGKILFQPVSEPNYLTSSFGLANFSSIPIVREELKAEVVAMEENIPFVISPERRENNGFRPYLKYAAILLLAFSTGLTGYRFYQNQRLNEQVARQDAQEYVTKQIQEATFFDLSPLELPTVTVEAKTKTTTATETTGEMHHIVAGAFRIKDNAERKISELKSKGFNAAYFGTNAYGLHVVTYDRFNNPQDALKALREIKRTQSKDAWLLSKK
jgi:hypothetical protein